MQQTGKGVVEVAVVGVFVDDPSVMSVSFISFVYPTFANGGVDGSFDSSVGSMAQIEAIKGAIESTV